MRVGLIFDLDGTLVDTVYAHVFAWQRAFAEAGVPIDGWRIHRRVGMSGGLFARAAAREAGREFTPDEVEALQVRHGELYRELLPERRPLPGAVRLLAELRELGVPHGIATSGRRPEIDASLDALGVPADTVIIERGSVARAKPEPDLFLACAAELGLPPDQCYVVGDAVLAILNLMVQYPTTVDRAFAALADPTRRAVLERLGSRSATISELAEPFGMSLTGMKKHIRLLEEAELVTTEKVGRVRRCMLAPYAFEGISTWLQRLDRFAQVVERTKGAR
jgi:HAD superfamily hydrolase (TIGR01509 family)